jgi:hypothetical protein
MKEWNANLTLSRRYSMRDPLVCSRLFAANKSFDQTFLKHSYPNLYK